MKSTLYIRLLIGSLQKFSLLLFIPFYLHAQTQFNFNLEISDQQVVLPQQILLKAVFTFPKEYRVDLDAVRKNLSFYPFGITNPFKVISEKIFPERLNINNQKALQMEILMEPLIAGSYPISFLNVPFIPLNNQLEPFEIYTKIYTVTVKLPVLNLEEVIPPAGLMPLSLDIPLEVSDKNLQEFVYGPQAIQEQIAKNRTIFRNKKLPLFFLMSVVLLISLVYAVQKLYPKFMKHYLVQSPKEFALTSLENLKRGPLWNQKRFTEVYIEIRRIFRKFLEKEYQIQADVKTSPELFNNIQKLFHKDTSENIELFLAQSDLVKFAEYHPSQKDAEEALNTVTKFIASSN